MKDSRLLIFISFIFILLGLALPFYLDSQISRIPFGISFLADGILLLLIGIFWWMGEVYEEALHEDELQNWLETRGDFVNLYQK